MKPEPEGNAEDGWGRDRRPPTLVKPSSSVDSGHDTGRRRTHRRPRLPRRRFHHPSAPGSPRPRRADGCVGLSRPSTSHGPTGSSYTSPGGVRNRRHTSPLPRQKPRDHGAWQLPVRRTPNRHRPRQCARGRVRQPRIAARGAAQHPRVSRSVNLSTSAVHPFSHRPAPSPLEDTQGAHRVCRCRCDIRRSRVAFPVYEPLIECMRFCLIRKNSHTISDEPYPSLILTLADPVISEITQP